MFIQNLADKLLLKDNKAQVFSLDVLLALIIITVIVGMSANAVDKVGFKITDYSAGKSLDRITTDAADILINTPGSPDWEKSNNTLFVTPGLADDVNGSMNTTKVLSLKKLSQLQSKYPDLMNNILPKGLKSSLIIYPFDTALKTLIVHDETPPQNASHVVVANRTVLINFMDYRIFLSFNTYFNNSLTEKNDDHPEFCPHHNLTSVTEHDKPNFNSKMSGWTCKCFKITQNDLNNTDFYILTSSSGGMYSSARWLLDRSDNISEDDESLNVRLQMVNGRISSLLGDDKEALLWLHVFSSGDASESFNVYLIGVPKGTPPEEVKAEYLTPQPCYFVLKVWV